MKSSSIGLCIPAITAPHPLNAVTDHTTFLSNCCVEGDISDAIHSQKEETASRSNFYSRISCCRQISSDDVRGIAKSSAWRDQAVVVCAASMKADALYKLIIEYVVVVVI